MSDANNQEQPIKLAIMGMENAGKTTIVDLLEQKTDEIPTKPPYMNPTRGVERKTLFQKNIVIWDFGGQELYRNEYLASPESYFHKTSSFYFVVDIQDYYRFFSCIMYFLAVFQKIRKFSPDVRFIFLFHKMDPDYDPNEKKLKEKFLEKIEPTMKASNTPFEMYDTTIFDLNSIKTAFSKDL